MTDGRRPIEERLSAAALPPLPRTAWLEIDLDALLANLAAIRGSVPPGTAIRPVVKADAYGHGAVPVARALQDAGVDGLCVAAFDEAVELRDAGIEAPIAVLYPVPAGLVAAAADLGVAVSAGDPVLLARMLDGVAAAAGHPDLAVELEIESGLGRDGFDGADLLTAAAAIRSARGVRLAGLWTHLQAPEDLTRTERQMARFEAAAASLRDAGIDLPHRHAAASAGILLGDVGAYDGIRPGLAIYGLVPDEILGTPAGDAARRALRPILSLRARPVRVLDLPAGSGIGYGPSFETARPSRIATLPIGYGDGWSRALSNRAEALVRGRRAPLVGNVSMDAVMVDVTDIPGGPVTPDDEFTLIGEDGGERIEAADLARTRTTNSWEVVTAMARRLPRVYDAAPGAVALRTLSVRRPLGAPDLRAAARAHARVPYHPRHDPPPAGPRRPMSTPIELTDDGRDELVEQVAREIQLRGLTGPAVHFLEASRPYRSLGSNAMLFFDPVLRGLFGGELTSANEILADEDGIEQLIARLEELDEEVTWDA